MSEHFIEIKEKDIESNLINLSQLVFEVTENCNLSCRYCGYGELYQGYDPREKKNLSIKKACNIIYYLVNLWKENIRDSMSQQLSISFYGGEPLLNMKLIKEIIEYIESLNITTKRIQYNLTTNGLLLHNHMDYLVNKKFSLWISLDGDKKDNSYRVDHHGRDSHKRVYENSKLLQQKYPEYFKEYVNFNSVLHNRNSVESAHQYINSNFGKYATISPLNNSGIRKDKVNEFIKMYQNKQTSIDTCDHQEELEKELFLESPKTKSLTNFFYMFSGNMFENFISLFSDVNRIKTIPTGACIPFQKKMFITVNGKILPCEKINHEFAMGQILEEGVDLNFGHIAQKSNDYIFRFTSQCKTCAFMKRCTQCVYQIDEICSTEPKCHSYKSAELFQEIINLDLDYLSLNPSLYKKIMKEVHIRK